MFQYISCYSLSHSSKISTEYIHVSIHLMLLFIASDSYRVNTSSCFNTSHVTLYHDFIGKLPCVIRFQYISCYSLSGIYQGDDGKYYMFQYISCYSLSISTYKGLDTKVFQYISCYSLSRNRTNAEENLTVSIHLMLLFIDIRQKDICSATGRFNTSHVTLYRGDRIVLRNFLDSFNTSHVTLYLSQLQ